MANSKYAQVADFLAQGKLRWATDTILAVLVKDAAFDETQKTLSQVGPAVRSVPIPGRSVGEGGVFYGQAVFFSDVPGQQEYQLVVVQDLNNRDPNLIAWYDSNDQGDPMLIENTGTLVVRPTLEVAPIVDQEAPQTPTTARAWMKV